MAYKLLSVICQLLLEAGLAFLYILPNQSWGDLQKLVQANPQFFVFPAFCTGLQSLAMVVATSHTLQIFRKHQLLLPNESFVTFMASLL